MAIKTFKKVFLLNSLILKIFTFIVLYASFKPLHLKAVEQVDLGETFGNNKDVSFSAETTEYNVETKSITAYGNVVIEQDDMTIKSDSFHYDRQNKWIFLSGNVLLVDKTVNQEIFLDEVYLVGSSAVIIGTNVGLILQSEAIIRGEHIVKKDSKIDVFRPALTSCPVYNGKIPLWELQASKLSYNQDKNKLSIYSGTISFKGVPIAWIPYMQYSGEKNVRKTGLLVPEVGSVNNTSYIENNLFINLTETQNIYLKHRIHGNFDFANGLANIVDLSDMRNMLQYEHYGYIKDGNFNLMAGVIESKNYTTKKYVKGNLKHPLTDIFRAEANIEYLNEDDFAREYDLTDVIETEEKFTQNYVKLEAITNSLYVSLNGSNSRNIKVGQMVYDPSLQSSYFLDFEKYGNVSGRSDIYYIKTEQNEEEGLAGSSLDYNKNLITRAGVINTNIGLRAANKINQTESSDAIENYYLGSSLSTSLEVPFSKQYSNGAVTLSPVVGFFLSDFLLSSEAGWSEELKANTTESFISNNYFYTWDSFAKQSIINYGLKGSIVSTKYTGNFFVGLSNNIDKNREQNTNDLLASVNFYTAKHFNFYYQGSYQIEDRTFSENHLYASFRNSLFSIESSYILGSVYNDVYNNVNTDTRNDEILSAISFKATENINVYASSLLGVDSSNEFNDNKTFLKEFEVGVLWKNACLTFGTLIGVTRYNIGGEEIDLSASIFLELKGLGQIKSEDENDFERKIFKY